jgi:hypothetical protein
MAESAKSGTNVSVKQDYICLGINTKKFTWVSYIFITLEINIVQKCMYTIYKCKYNYIQQIYTLFRMRLSTP